MRMEMVQPIPTSNEYRPSKIKEETRLLLILACRVFGEKGYKIKEPALTWKKRGLIFLAVRPDWPNQLVLLGHTRKGSVVVRPYDKTDWHFRDTFDSLMNNRNRPRGVRLLMGSQLQAVTDDPSLDWRFYYPRSMWEELKVPTEKYPEVVKPRSNK